MEEKKDINFTETMQRLLQVSRKELEEEMQNELKPIDVKLPHSEESEEE